MKPYLERFREAKVKPILLGSVAIQEKKMPPKKPGGGKANEKVQKKVEDKTFGLKNKNKSSKVQKYVAQVQQAAQQSAASAKRANAGPSKKELEKQKKEALNEIFKPVQVAQKVPFGVDPKTIVCQYFKLGTCTKGKNCKFSHDLGADRKSTKIDLYTDKRAQDDDEKAADTMDTWDQAKLEEVVAKKHGKGIPTTTEIVCKYFLQAVEESKYGWFWQCPNGDSCKYRHALPPGFVLKSQQAKKNADEPVQTLEEWIEEQRASLPTKLTPVTLESFQKWKHDRQVKLEQERLEKEQSREQAIKAGKQIGASGRELFTYNPELFNTADDDEDVWEGDYTQRDSEDDQDGEFDESVFAAESLEDLDLDDGDDLPHKTPHE